MGKYVVPQKLIRRLNPNGGKQRGIPEKKCPGIANPKGDPSWRQTELIPRASGTILTKIPVGAKIN